MNDNGEDFSISLSSPAGITSSCQVSWVGSYYRGQCSVPAVPEAGNWNLKISLDGDAFGSSMVHMNCEDGYYEDPQTQTCNICPRGTTCPIGTTLESMQVNPGYWRAGKPNRRTHSSVRRDSITIPPLFANSGLFSVDVRECGFTALDSCPGTTNGTDTCPEGAKNSQYCACGYRGPLCSECDADYFAEWTGSGGCKECNQGESHTPTMLLGSFVVVCGLFFCREMREKDQAILSKH